MIAFNALVYRQNKFRLKQGVALFFGTLFSMSVHATNELVLQMETSISGSHNPFRYYDGQSDSTQVIPHHTDTVEGADIRAGVIVPVLSDETRLMLTGSLGGRRYINDGTLNHLQGGANADFQWVASKLLSGRINAGAGQHLFNYINGSLSQKDIEHDKNAGFDVNIKVTDSWWLMPKLFYNQLYYDLPVNKLYDYKQDGRQIGVRYMSPTGSSVEGGVRLSTTNYTDRSQDQIEKIYDIPYANSVIKPEYDTQFKETELYLDGEWQYSVKTTTSAHVGVIRRRYSTYSNLDTNLSNAIVRGTYRYTPQLRLDAQMFDQPFPIVDPTILYVVTKGVRLDALWLYSDKLQFNASAVMQNSSQVYIPGIVNLTGNASQVARMKRVGVGASYQIDRGFRLFADSYFERNRGDVATLNVNQSVVKIGFEYTYENLPGSAARMNLQRYQDYLSSSPAIAR
ncbi:hypothetical protein ACO0K0_01990 [Undibacterium sp. SXout11W]|uniref:hypothetical protein n=1 Tax=Undibacterium sp. SXout11W TaxID=3413050 RepID=UPI003BF2AE5F